MKTLLVPVSFSKTSINAATYAADMALTLNARLHLLFVMTMPLSVGEAPLSESFLKEMESSYLEEMEDLKTKLARQTQEKIEISTTLDWGNVEEKIESACKEIRPFLVIMGISPRTVQHVLIGSRTLQAIGRLRYPILAIPDDSRFREIRKIGLACDLSHIESIPVNFFRELSEVFKASLEIIYITKDNRSWGLVKEQTALLLNRKLNGIAASLHLIRESSVEEGISKFQENHPVDLLLLLPKWHDFFEFHSSHTRKMAVRSRIPILSLHA
jgi:nucleotide-binding universal stress UspA family protein